MRESYHSQSYGQATSHSMLLSWDCSSIGSSPLSSCLLHLQATLITSFSTSYHIRWPLPIFSSRAPLSISISIRFLSTESLRLGTRLLGRLYPSRSSSFYRIFISCWLLLCLQIPVKMFIKTCHTIFIVLLGLGSLS